MEWWVLLGVVAGMRTMTPIAVFCCFAAMGAFPHGMDHTWAVWTTKWISAVVFVVLALGEYVGDVLPQTPSRREPLLALARTVSGGLVGALAATSMTEPVVGGVIAGVIGAAIGTWGGWWVRVSAGEKVGKDWPVGLGESAVALGIAVWMCWRIGVDARYWAHVQAGFNAAAVRVVHAVWA